MNTEYLPYSSNCQSYTGIWWANLSRKIWSPRHSLKRLFCRDEKCTISELGSGTRVCLLDHKTGSQVLGVFPLILCEKRELEVSDVHPVFPKEYAPDQRKGPRHWPKALAIKIGYHLNGQVQENALIYSSLKWSPNLTRLGNWYR